MMTGIKAALLADKGYDVEYIVKQVEQQGMMSYILAICCIHDYFKMPQFTLITAR